jgi:hypothetical protein
MATRIICIGLFCVLLLTTLAQSYHSTAQAPVSDGKPDQIVLQPTTVGGETAQFAAGATTEYLSPPTQAPSPFTHMLVRRDAMVPPGAALTLFVRASTDGANWSDWGEVHVKDDLFSEKDGPDVVWGETIEVGAVGTHWQVRGVLTASPEGTMPVIRTIDVNTVDTNAFTPAAASNATEEFERNAANGGAPKPSVISRTGWGSPDGQGSRANPAYYPVNHITVHHSADSNSLYPSEPNWAARVRAFWSFHTHTRGWGDIGYNYVIDPNGVIYEGRAGGDDAVAFHDTANYGSMGVVVIGAYSSVTPTEASRNSLVKLMAWKAAQKDIDPLGSSYYYGCAISKYCKPFNAGAVTPNIAGHRQVTPGHTTCPGDAFMALMPGIRNQVKQLMSSGAPPGQNNGDLEIDELETSFARSAANWYEAACGAGGHTFYSYATDNPAESTNRATWRPNIPKTGTYRVFAHIPQGCGLAPPPYASRQAKYIINHAGGTAEKVVDQNTDTAWIDLGLYTFNQGESGAVELFDLTGEPYSQKRVLFFDSVKWVAESANDNVAVTNVAYDRTTLASGELLKVTFTVKNTGSTIAQGQAPHVDLTAGGGLNDLNNGYVYDQDECFLGNSAGSYPAFPKAGNRFRVMLGMPGWDASHTATCKGGAGDYPWRWGLNADLAPGQEQTIIGYVRFRAPGAYQLQAGLIQEYVKYFAKDTNPMTINVTPEKAQPDAAVYDGALNPAARVYRLGAIPDNFLGRTENPLSIPRGEYIGSFAWDGSYIDWFTGGPLNVTDNFMVEQTRAFVVPTNGTYTFRTVSDDGSWLWVNGKPVVVNHGLHGEKDVSGTIDLSAGVHTVAFKYFDRGGPASAGYSVKLPGSEVFTSVSDAISNSSGRLGMAFFQAPELVIAADDQGGVGVSRIRWSWDGAAWQESPGALLKTGRLDNGDYRLRYQSIDNAGNASDVRELAFKVDTNMVVHRSFLPLSSR